MRGDFSRDSFDPFQHFTGVLMQQGRVQLDADWNEQVAIGQHFLRALARDLIGSFGGPDGDCGFQLTAALPADATDRYGNPLDPVRRKELQGLRPGDFLIGPGRYYVEGRMCENDEWIAFSEQAGYPFDGIYGLDPLTAGTFLFYLDVWERQVTIVDDPDLAEVALGGPDTVTRSQLVWQVRALTEAGVSCASWTKLRRGALPRLRASTREPQDNADACVLPADARYRGAENQLYRVEIHRSGTATPGGATFTWSRDNGSVVFPVRELAWDATAKQTTATLATLGRDRRLRLAEGDWVELVDETSVLGGTVRELQQVERVDPDDLRVVLSAATGAGQVDPQKLRYPALRRWDHDGSAGGTGDDGALPVTEVSTSDDRWIELEDGVLIQFPASADAARPNDYRIGDYWLIPARTATGDVVWPSDTSGGTPVPAARPPRGVEHVYAPLALVAVDPAGAVTVDTPDCRRRFDVLPAVSP